MPSAKSNTPECSRCRRELALGGRCAPYAPIATTPALLVEGLPAWKCSGCGHVTLTASASDMGATLAEAVHHALRRGAVRSGFSRAAAEAGLARLADAPVLVQLDTVPASSEDASSREELFEVVPVEALVDDLDDLIAGPGVVDAVHDFLARTNDPRRLRAALGPRLARHLDRSGLALVGPPGTGKTMIARAIARRLRRPLLVADLSQLESSEVGEAQRRIRRLFTEAAARKCVLFIDEADSLVDARVKATNGHEKHLNSSRNVFITSLNAFRGVVILASNLPESFDTAIARRVAQLFVPPPEGSVLRRGLEHLLGQVALAEPADSAWIDRLAGQVEEWTRTHPTQGRPFTLWEFEVVLERASTRAFRLTLSGEVTVSRAEVENALLTHLATMCAAPSPPTTEAALALAATPVGEALTRTALAHRSQLADATLARPEPTRSEGAYRKAAEVTMTRLVTGYSAVLDVVENAARALTADRPEDVLAGLRAFGSLVAGRRGDPTDNRPGPPLRSVG